MTTNQIVAAMHKRVALAMYASNSDRLPRAALGERHAVEMVDVLEHNPTRHVGTDMDYTQREIARKRSIRVRIIKGLHESKTNTEVWVDPRFLLATWDEYFEARTAHLVWVERAKNAKANAAAKRATDAVELEGVLSLLGFRTDVPFSDPNRVAVRETGSASATPTATVTLTLAQVKTLIERAQDEALKPFKLGRMDSPA